MLEENEEIYYPIDNGGKPFKVIVNTSANTVHVYANVVASDTFPLIQSRYMQMFIGKNNMPFDTHYSDELFTGSAILAFINEKESKYSYLFIGGSELYYFDTPEPIISFYAMMGNSAVVYSYAVSYSRTYLLIEHKYVQRGVPTENPYHSYYSNSDSGTEFVTYGKIKKSYNQVTNETSYAHCA